MKTYLCLIHPDPFLPAMKFQVFELITRPTSSPVYSSADATAKLQGTIDSADQQTVRHLLGWGHNKEDALAMATKKGFVEWQELDARPVSTKRDSKP